MPREDAVAAYSVYQRSQYKGDQPKSFIALAEELTITNGFALDMIACNQGRMCKFYEDRGIPQGIAWSYVCNVTGLGKCTTGHVAPRAKIADGLL